MDGIVFDFDGVLGDTMRQHAEAYRRLLAPHGVEFEDRKIFLLEGARSETIIRDLLGRAAKGHDMAAMADEKQRIFTELGTPGLYPRALSIVKEAAKRCPLGLVTGTRRENLERLVPEIMDHFQAIMAQADYTHDKPHPEPYAKAADALGIDPARLVAVENAQRGIQSARAAGYGRVVAIETTLTTADLMEADMVARDHAHLQAILEGLVAG